MLKRFNEIFGIQDSLKEERRKFVQRINQTIFKDVETKTSYAQVFCTLCLYLGENADDITSHIKFPGTSMIRSLTNDTFDQTIKVVHLLYQYFDDKVKNKQMQNKIDRWVKEFLSQATVDLGIKWENGMFYPSGAKVLDEKLVGEPLEWLKSYPDEKRDFLKALDSYFNKRLEEVVNHCYLVVEGLTRKVLRNNKTLDNNREELLKNVGLSQEWKSFLSNYINYANEFNRHASDKRHAINSIEVEAFLYFTGLLVRLIIESK